jgi:hypothetical protein
MTEQDDALKQFHAAFLDHKAFAEQCLTVRAKKGELVPFVMQPAQIKLNAAIQKCKEQGKPARIIFLKARQVMVSTATAAQFIHRVPFKAGRRAMIVAHDKTAATNIFGYYDTFESTYQPFQNKLPMPERKRSASAAGMIEWENGSYIRVASANNLESGRSFSLNYLHLSEYAFWRDASTLMTGLMQTVPDDPESIVIIESTANGKGGDFYQRWQEATDPSSGSEWIPLFFGWWEHPAYQRPITDRAAFQASLSREERELQTRFTLSLEQLHWRRWCIKTNCGNDVDKFKQEYPATPEEAFLYSGRPRFDHKALSRMPIKGDKLVGELHREQIGIRTQLVFRPNEDARGALTVYKKPAQHKRYVIGIDVAEGIDAGDGIVSANDPDYSVANVLDGDTGEQVARLRGRIEPGVFAEYTAALAEWFNWAYLVPEANGPGIAFLEQLLREGYPTGLIYHRRPQPDEKFRADAFNRLQDLGWKNTATTKVQLIDALDIEIRQMGIMIVDSITLNECLSFVRKPDGKQEAADGDHDDEVIALALAVIGIRTQPPDRTALGFQKKAHTAPQMTVQQYGQRRLPAERGARPAPESPYRL